MIAFASYLLKVAICSGVLFLYYHFALRNKLFHQWNRFYLLAAVLLSLLVPVIQFSIVNYITDPSSKAIKVLQVFESADGYMDEVIISGRGAFSPEQWISAGYILISFGFFLLVVHSLIKLWSIIRLHEIIPIGEVKFISSEANGTPFSFFRYIFWNKKIDLQTQTGQQIFEHELVHVREKHTLDKLFIQFVLVFFWCNPFFWLIRRELKMIHEFIADKKAVGEHGTAALAAMILNASYPTQFNAITNHFFQTSIKRRLAMLTKVQNPRIQYLSRLLALFVVVTTVLAFTLKSKTVNAPLVQLDRPVTVVIDAGHGLMPNGKLSGAHVNDVYEDNIVLGIAQKIKALNGNDKINIVLTRSSDKIVDLHQRVDIARKNNADLFISLHVNLAQNDAEAQLASGPNIKSGFAVYVSNKEPPYQQESEVLGSVLTNELSTVYHTSPFLMKRKVGVWVLDQNVCPSVLLECGFLTDKKDREFITSTANQEAVARQTLRAVELYFANLSTRTKQSLENVSEKKEATVISVTSQAPAEKNERDTSGFNISAENPPLMYLDGKEITRQEMEKINPQSIQSINVLKGKSATEKYGSRGKYGAIEIQSKPQSGVETSDVTVGDENNKAVDTIAKNKTVFQKAEIEASVGKEEWTHFLQTNLLPVIEKAASDGIKPGKYEVMVKFLVDADGSISGVRALNDPGYGIAQQIVEMMRNSPKWKPAQQNHKPVNSYHTQPITFVIQEQDNDKDSTSKNADTRS